MVRESLPSPSQEQKIMEKTRPPRSTTDSGGMRQKINRFFGLKITGGCTDCNGGSCKNCKGTSSSEGTLSSKSTISLWDSAKPKTDNQIGTNSEIAEIPIQEKETKNEKISALANADELSLVSTSSTASKVRPSSVTLLDEKLPLTATKILIQHVTTTISPAISKLASGDVQIASGVNMQYILPPITEANTETTAPPRQIIPSNKNASLSSSDLGISTTNISVPISGTETESKIPFTPNNTATSAQTHFSRSDYLPVILATKQGLQHKETEPESAMQFTSKKSTTVVQSDIEAPPLSTRQHAKISRRSKTSASETKQKDGLINGYTYVEILASPWLRKLYGHLIGITNCEASASSEGTSNTIKTETNRKIPKFKRAKLNVNGSKSPVSKTEALKRGSFIKSIRSEPDVPRVWKKNLGVQLTSLERIIRKIASSKAKNPYQAEAIKKEFKQTLVKIEKLRLEKLNVLKKKRKNGQEKLLEGLLKLLRLLRRRWLIAELLANNKKGRHKRGLLKVLLRGLKKLLRG